MAARGIALFLNQAAVDGYARRLKLLQKYGLAERPLGGGNLTLQ